MTEKEILHWIFKKTSNILQGGHKNLENLETWKNLEKGTFCQKRLENLENGTFYSEKNDKNLENLENQYFYFF